MLVIVSWYSDGSGQPEVKFANPQLLAKSVPQGALGAFIKYVRETQEKNCKVYSVTDSGFELVYDSTDKESK